MNIQPDILDILAHCREIRGNGIVRTKPKEKKYYDFTVRRNWFALYLLRVDGRYDQYTIEMSESDVTDFWPAQKIVNTVAKVHQLQASIEEHNKSGTLRKVITIHTLL